MPKPYNFMVNKLSAVVLASSLAIGCTKDDGYKPMISPNSALDPCPICREINSETIESRVGTYEDYSVKVVIKESRWGEPIGKRQRAHRINLGDYQNNALVAEIRARTEWGKEDFNIYFSKSPKRHPFRQYTPKKLKEIYDLIMDQDKK